jgi:hypothetical protein
MSQAFYREYDGIGLHPEGDMQRAFSTFVHGVEKLREPVPDDRSASNERKFNTEYALADFKKAQQIAQALRVLGHDVF